MIKDTLRKLVESENLTTDETKSVMNEIMEGNATDAQIGAFLVSLRMKGETVEEITGCAEVMREKSIRVNAGPGIVVDTCGTGGDVSHTFNISTATAIVVAGAGVKVAKHGNRSVSSKCGSADVLETLGVNLDASVAIVEKCIQQVGVGFMFAPLLHRAMKYAIGPRKELGLRTIFNLLGPLTNPAGARHQLIGVFDAQWTDPIAKVLMRLGSSHALVVHGLDGLDEISITSPTQISELQNGTVRTYEVTPKQFGLEMCSLEDLQVKDADQSAAILTEIFNDKKCPHADIVLLNAAAALYAADAASSLAEGFVQARKSIESGNARTVLSNLIKISQNTQNPN